MTPTSASASLSSDRGSYGDAPELRRAVIALVVVAAHVALLFVIGRGARPAAEVVEVTFFPLPITPDETMREPTPAPEPKASPVRASARPRAKSPPQDEAAPTPLPTTPAAPPETPAAPIDWYAETRRSADALAQRDRSARERRSLAGPTQPSLAGPRHAKPPCPFEKCEPNWRAGSSIFESENTKAGRIEKAADGEVIRWISNRCFQILVTPNLMHRGMTKCVTPLKKAAPRGDLFKHMKEAPPPEERATDVP